MEGEVYSLLELHDKMKELANSDEVYTRKWLKTKLKNKYGEEIFFAELQGKTDVVCFRDSAEFIINDKWYENKKENITEEAERIVKQAAKIILGQIRSTKFNTDTYPLHGEISNIEIGKEWIPSYIRLFMESMMKKELKQVIIGQAIVNAVKSRSCIAPLLFGLEIKIDKVFGSKWLLTELNRLGFSIRHDETTRYKQSVVCNEDVSDFIKANLSGQWSADNVDHNVCTIDGKGTLHGMGLIVSTTPGSSLLNLTPIPRQKMKHAGEVNVGKGIPVLYYDPPDESGLSSVILKPLNELKVENVLPKYILNDYLWHISYFLPNPRPCWS